ncbi:MAG: GNAT family N-acetyltransferase [Nitrososphaerales archaeon]
MTLEIRPLQAPEEARLAAELQRLIWGGDEVPAHVLLTAAHNGGLCAGAFVDGTLAGFVWGFLGLDDRLDPPRLKHCSHQLGVHPDYRNQGLGFLLKHFQWEFVLRQGIELITWTYDPLLAANAHLNIARLGAICNTYRRDEYGELDDDLNAGLATDRFQVDLWVSSPWVREAMQGQRAHSGSLEDVYWLNRPAADQDLEPPSPAALAGLHDAGPGRVAVAIPPDFQAKRGADPQLAAAWRCATRDAFETLFAHSYSVVDFVRLPAFGCYILEDNTCA